MPDSAMVSSVRPLAYKCWRCCSRMVEAIFRLYAQHEALIPVVQELERRGWTNKRWITQKKEVWGGKPFTKTSLHKLLVNVTYIGKAKYRDEVFEGEQPAIVPHDLWQKVQRLLTRNSKTGGAVVRNKNGALLKGKLHCMACDSAMTPTYVTKKGKKRYRYYVCSSAQKRGWHSCPSKSIPAGEIERVVIEQIRGVGQDPALVRTTFAEARKLAQRRIKELDAETRRLERDSRGATEDERHAAERRLADIHAERLGLEASLVTEDEVATALADFDALWESMTPAEQTKVIGLLIDRVEYHGGTGKVGITFAPTGIRTLAQQFTEDAA